MTEYNLSDYTVEIVTDFTEEFINYVVDLYDGRSNEIQELNNNYTAETMRRCFDTGRFNHGFVIIKEGCDVIATLGIDGFRGWGVFSRYLAHKPGKLRVLLGIMWPKIDQHTKGKVIGLCSTHNTSTRNLVAIARRKILSGSASNPLMAITAEVYKNTKVLDSKVMYRGTVQEVITYYTDLIPPFDRV